MRLLGQDVARQSVAVVAVDACIVATVLAAFGASFGAAGTLPNSDALYSQANIAFVLTWGAMMIALQGYARKNLSDFYRATPRVILASIAASLAVVITLALSNSASPAVGQTVLAPGVIVVLACLVRLAIAQLPAIGRKLESRSIVIGTGIRARRLLNQISDQQWHSIAGFVPERPDEDSGPIKSEVPAELVLPWSSDLVALARRHRASRIVIAADEPRSAGNTDQLDSCCLAGIKVVEETDFVEGATGRVNLDYRRLKSRAMQISQGQSRLDDLAKRALDIMFSIALIVLTLPLLVTAAIAVRVTSSGPVLFRQLRVGRGERQFNMLKLRTMTHVESPQPDGPRFTGKNDQRITPVGRILRRIRIDELPQLFNVLKGDMSLVGPRPERPGEGYAASFGEAIPSYRLRHQVRPGLTGWAQINFGYCGEALEDHWVKTSFDLFYLKNRSLLFDVVILVQTLNAVLFGDNDARPANQTIQAMAVR